MKASGQDDTIRRICRAAGRGHVEAQVLLGQALLDGILLPRDAPAAFAWFTWAAGSGHLPGLNMRGRCLENGWGIKADPAAAASCYRAAAEAGDPWAQYNLANMLLRGRAVRLDRVEAWRWFLSAATSGHAKSMNLVARFLEEGWDRPRDPRAALAWYRRSAEAGDYRGRHNLAALLAEAGKEGEALAWWREALPDATPDILEAMRAALVQLAHPDARALAAQVRGRLPAGRSLLGRLLDRISRAGRIRTRAAIAS